MAVTGDELRYVWGQVPMHGRLFRDTAWTAPRPGVLVFPEGFGISDHTLTAAARVAELGYAAMACDLYGNGYFSGGPGAEVEDRHRQLLSRPDGMLEIGMSALGALQGRPEVDSGRIAATGFCIGATIAMELSFAGAGIAAVAGFHPSFRGLSYARASALACPMNLFMGSRDYASPVEERARLEAAFEGNGSDWRMTIYGGVRHSYMNPDCPGMGDRVGFDPRADAHSWAALADLLASVLKGD